MKHDAMLTLRELTLTESDLMVPWNYFMSHFAERPRFVGSCARVAGPAHLVPGLDAVAMKVFGRGLGERPPLVLKAPEAPMVHGATMIRSGLLSYYYFTDVEVGLAAALNPGSPLLTVARLRALPPEAADAVMARAAASTH